MSDKQERFTDTGEYLLNFMQEYSVVCPRCDKCARVAVTESGIMPLFAPRQLTCTHCGYTAEWRENRVASQFFDTPLDWYFQRPFYYRTSCCGHELWVLNRAHLELLREFVSARIRSRVKNARGWSNRSLISRLPKWIAVGTHRAEILSALKKIERMMNIKR